MVGVFIFWWYYVDCFVKSREFLLVDVVVIVEFFSGFIKFKKEDKDLLKSKLGFGGKKKGKGSKRKVVVVDEIDVKRKKIVEEDEIEIKFKVCLFFKYKLVLCLVEEVLGIRFCWIII